MKQVFLIGCIAVLLVGCTTAFQRADGTYDVPRSVEVRSPFGTNAGFVKLEHCATKVSPWYWFAEYTDCHAKKNWAVTQSQGQGGQLAAGAMVGLGFGLGSVFANTSSATSSAVSHSASSATVITKGHGHH